MSKVFALVQTNVRGYYLENFPEVALISSESKELAIEVAKNLGVDFLDSCDGCCGNRWDVMEYDPMFHGSDVPDIMEWANA